MITHEQLIFCFCGINKNIKFSEHGEKYLIVMPLNEDGSQAGDAFIEKWKYQFKPPSKEEVSAYWEKNKKLFFTDPFQEGLEEGVRRDRDRLLKELDEVVCNPLRWSGMSSKDKQKWEKYRKSLLNIPQQKGFPLKVRWPDKPQ